VSSKKRSPTSLTLELLEASTSLFLDHNLGNKQLPGLLRMAGLKIECHLSHFPGEEPDDVWIRECARKGWIIFTSDKNIENDPLNRQAAIESEARIFFLDDGNTRSVFWAAAITVSKERIYSIISTTKGPFFANITRETGVLVREVRTPTNELPKPTALVTNPNRANEWFKMFVKF
jgi:hypothetical protein